MFRVVYKVCFPFFLTPFNYHFVLFNICSKHVHSLIINYHVCVILSSRHDTSHTGDTGRRPHFLKNGVWPHFLMEYIFNLFEFGSQLYFFYKLTTTTNLFPQYSWKWKTTSTFKKKTNNAKQIKADFYAILKNSTAHNS